MSNAGAAAAHCCKCDAFLDGDVAAGLTGLTVVAVFAEISVKVKKYVCRFTAIAAVTADTCAGSTCAVSVFHMCVGRFDDYVGITGMAAIGYDGTGCLSYGRHDAQRRPFGYVDAGAARDISVGITAFDGECAAYGYDDVAVYRYCGTAAFGSLYGAVDEFPIFIVAISSYVILVGSVVVCDGVADIFHSVDGDVLGGDPCHRKKE